MKNTFGAQDKRPPTHLHAQVAIGCVCLVMAFAVTVQIRSVSFNRVNNSMEARSVELQQRLSQEQQKNESLYQQVLQLRDDVDKYRGAAETNEGYSKVIFEQLERAELLAGLTPVEGPGIIVTLKDSTLPASNMINPNAYVVHDTDILWIMNELCDAGAEALTLNGERIVAISEVRCAGATVSVNNARFAQPFEIVAVGNSTNMENALTMRGGVYDSLRESIDITIKKTSKATINAYTGKLSFDYANPIRSSKEGQ